jgi:hypothetical protein
MTHLDLRLENLFLDFLDMVTRLGLLLEGPVLDRLTRLDLLSENLFLGVVIHLDLVLDGPTLDLLLPPDLLPEEPALDLILGGRAKGLTRYGRHITHPDLLLEVLAPHLILGR